MKTRQIAAIGIGCMCVMLLCGGSMAKADEPAKQAETQPATATETDAVSGRFVTLTVQQVGERNVTGLLIALPEGGGLVTVVVEPGEGAAPLLATAKKLDAGQPVRVTVKKADGQLWATDLKVVEQDKPKVEEKVQEQVEHAVAADAAAQAQATDKVDEEYKDADSRARAKIKQLEHRVAELEEQVRQLRAAAAAGANKEEPKDKPAEKKTTGTSEGKVMGLTQKTVGGRTLPAVVVTTDGGAAAFVVPLVKNDKGEKAYDPAVRAVVEGLKNGQQVRIVWESDGKEKMIKTIEVAAEEGDRGNWPRRRRRD